MDLWSAATADNPRVADCESPPSSEASEMIGAGAIKRPLMSYQEKVFASAIVDEQASEEYREIGWLFTTPEKRGKGVGTKIMDAIANELTNAPCFATTRTNNDAIKHIMPKYGLRKSGENYPSRMGDHSLMLFLKSRSISDGMITAMSDLTKGHDEAEPKLTVHPATEPSRETKAKIASELGRELSEALEQAVRKHEDDGPPPRQQR